MPAITIFAAFDEAMPTRTNPIPKDVHAHISGPSTQASDAPKLGLRLRNFFVPLSTNMIRSHLKTSHLATWEETRRLLVEADVSDAAAPQLINPVDIAFAAYHPKEIYHLNQDTVRIAMLDYKRPGVIRFDKFTQACCTPDEFNQRIARLDDDNPTDFEGNAEILLKQAVNYASQYKTKYIAFFDWETLVLIYLENAEKRNGGNWCHIEIVTDRRQMRRALLGFLEAGYQSCGGMTRGGPVYPMPQIPSMQPTRHSDRIR
ncbi:hypothetical protein CEP54_010215 [Fusarium duplospermum]|uniref:Uncharacterized protein n=1 Tax=Fusarium duplospermum TaxID=1325734 RepID=A0A428PL78_9HYPO|nr:hypothetical protein CEP54_010215 [Fusarium duplospermum]